MDLQNRVVHARYFRSVELQRHIRTQHLPDLLSDIHEIVDEQSQIDPTFRTTRLYTRLSAGEVRRQLIAQKGYTDDALPCDVTINNKLNEMGYSLRAVEKSKPQKKFPKQMPSLRN